MKRLRVDFAKLHFTRCWFGTGLTDWAVECPNGHVLTCWGEYRRGRIVHRRNYCTPFLTGMNRRATLWGIVERNSHGNAQAIWFNNKPRIRKILGKAGIEFTWCENET